MPVHRPDPDDFEMITLSFRALGRHSKIVHQAAQQKHMSTASYMRKTVLDWACADLGIEPPDYTALTTGPSQISEAARLRGMSVKDFTSLAVREAAARELEAKAREPEQRSSRTSEVRDLAPRSAPKRTQSGTRKVS